MPAFKGEVNAENYIAQFPEETICEHQLRLTAHVLLAKMLCPAHRLCTGQARGGWQNIC